MIGSLDLSIGMCFEENVNVCFILESNNIFQNKNLETLPLKCQNSDVCKQHIFKFTGKCFTGNVPVIV